MDPILSRSLLAILVGVALIILGVLLTPITLLTED